MQCSAIRGQVFPPSLWYSSIRERSSSSPKANDIIDRYAKRSKEPQARPHEGAQRISLTRFPNRLEKVSDKGLSWGVIILLGFVCGAFVMAWILA